MNLKFLQSIVIGFVSGFAEMLPVSAEAHRTLLRTFFGVEGDDAVFRFLVHTACLIVLALHYSGTVGTLRRANHLMKISPKRRKRPLSMSDANTVRLLRNAMTVMLVLRAGTLVLRPMGESLSLVCIGLVISGAMLILPAMFPNGNMDARNMPKLNGMLMGIGGGLAVVPGVAPVAGAMSPGQWRGVDRSFAMKFAHMLLIPGLLIGMVFDLVSAFTGGAAGFSFVGLLIALVGAVASGFGCHYGLMLMEKLVSLRGFTAFAYYNWGMALLCFTLFLMI